MKKSLNQGVSLIEVLVAMLILTVGLVGFAALQLQSLRYTNESYLQTHAEIVLYGMADRVRVNPAGFDASAGTTRPYSQAIDDDTKAVDCLKDSCSAAEIALNDLLWFRDQMRSLPEGRPGGEKASSGVAINPEGTVATLVGSFSVQDDAQAGTLRRQLVIMEVAL